MGLDFFFKDCWALAPMGLACDYQKAYLLFREKVRGGDVVGYLWPPQSVILKDYSTFSTLVCCLLASKILFCGAHLPEEIQIKNYTALS